MVKKKCDVCGYVPEEGLEDIIQNGTCGACSKESNLGKREVYKGERGYSRERYAEFFLMVLAFIIGIAIFFALEIGMLFLINEIFDTRLIPRGLGWFIIPILAGITLAKITPNLPVMSKIIKTDLLKSLNSKSPLVRFIIIAPVFWIVVVGLYVFLFEPYGYMSSSEYIHMTKVMVFPPVLLIAAYFTYIKLINPKSKNEK